MNLTVTNGEQLLLVLVLITIGLGALTLLATAVRLWWVLDQSLNPKPTSEQAETDSRWSWSLFMKRMTNAVPLQQEKTILLDHNYDGIHELDNHLPPWWKYLFYATIVFSVVYLVDYHWFGWSPLQDDEYQNEVAAAQKELEIYQATLTNSIDEKTVKLLITDPNVLAKGKGIYVGNCAACHGQLGEGGVGPNLTDPYWMHGGSVNDVFKTVKYGVPQKGMIAWKATLKPDEMQAVSNYILSLQGTNPPNAKPPQGEKTAGKPIAQL